MKRKLIYIIIAFYVFMFLTSIFAFQVERFDDHIKDENQRTIILVLRGLEIIMSGLTIFFFFIKQEKLSLFFGVIYVFILMTYDALGELIELFINFTP